jgi:hypothetical protein
MADMGEMEMPLPDNTLPMMTGQGQFGSLEMGGMFTVVKVRDGLAKGDFNDPGPYKNPAGTVAYEWTGESLNPQRAPTSRMGDINTATGKARDAREITVTVRKPQGHK